MDIKKSLKKNTEYLKNHNIENFYQDAEILLSFVLNKKREFLICHEDTKVSFFDSIRFLRCIKKRTRGYSVASIVGRKFFYGYDFFVNKNCLIPRPETELLIKEAKKIINKNNFTIIDVGTGTACIIITILKEILKKGIEDIDFKYFAIDISKKALKVAKKNLTLNSLDKKIILLKGDLLSPVLKDSDILGSSKNSLLITANLPYLTKEQIKTSPSIQKEPKLALDGGVEGLECYAKLFKQLEKISNNYSFPIHLLCEIDASQKKGIQDLQKKYLREFNIKIKKDLANKDRLAIFSKINT